MHLGNGPDDAVLREVRERGVNRFMNADLPLFGFPAAWPGSRSLGRAGHWESTEDSGDGTEPTTRHGEEYALVHGPGDPEGDPREPVVNVVTSTVDVADQALFRVLESMEPPILLDPVEMEDAAEAEAMDRPPPGTRLTTVDVDVDGTVTRFDAAVRGVAWVARHVFGDYALTIEARNFPPGDVSLVRVTDLGPYIEGLERRFDRYGDDRR